MHHEIMKNLLKPLKLNLSVKPLWRFDGFLWHDVKMVKIKTKYDTARMSTNG